MLRVAKDIMQLHGKAIQMSDVQRAEVCMERIVQQAAIDGEVDWR
jgi:hypothetical protein